MRCGTLGFYITLLSAISSVASYAVHAEEPETSQPEPEKLEPLEPVDGEEAPKQNAKAEADAAVNEYESEPTPLLPHPANRPRYNPDRSRRTLPPLKNPPDIPPPNFSQDKYARPESQEDYSDELRKMPEKGREMSEIEISKGIAQLNADKPELAAKNFQNALSFDPRNFVAHEYLGAVEEHKNRFREAVAELAQAKHMAPEPHWGRLNFQIGRLYILMKNYERAEAYLRLALKQDGHLTAANYALGYLLYLQQRYFEAEYYLHEAKLQAMRRTSRGAERELLQAIHYYLGEIYARMGYSLYAVSMLRETEQGESWEVRQSAWRVHSEVNQSAFYASVGVFGQYDSNVLLLPVSATLPIQFSSQGSAGGVLTGSAGWQSSPAKAWYYGTDLSTYYNGHLNSTLEEFDIFYFSLDAWLNWWNRKDWRFGIRYDFSDALVDRSAFSTFQVTNGPTISAAYFPFQRWNWEFGFSYRANSFPDDLQTGPDRRSGYTYIGFGRAALKAPNPRLRPTFGYTIEVDATNGENFQSRAHHFTGEIDWRWWTRTHLLFGFTYVLTSFPNHVTGRQDNLRHARLGLKHIIDEHWLLLGDLAYYSNTSTKTDFSYSRVLFSTGVSYRF